LVKKQKMRGVLCLKKFRGLLVSQLFESDIGNPWMLQCA